MPDVRCPPAIEKAKDFLLGTTGHSDLNLWAMEFTVRGALRALADSESPVIKVVDVAELLGSTSLASGAWGGRSAPSAWLWAGDQGKASVPTWVPYGART